MKKTIGILAHVDAGKTSFCEQVLYLTKSIRNKGRVDHKNSFLDNHEIEKERGITVFSEQAIFNLNDSTYYLIDTPGHIDFSCEMERSINVMDYAVIILSGVEGIQGHTKTVWNLLEKNNVPTFIFINKMDRAGYDKERIIKDIHRELSKDIFFIAKEDIDITHDNGKYINFNEELIEFISEQDEELLEKYLNGEYDNNIYEKELKELIKDRRVFLAFGGSALNNEGIEEFLYAIDKLSITNYDEYENEKFSGVVYKVRYDSNNTRNTFIKCIKGSLKVKDEISYISNKSNDDEIIEEKVNNIKIYNGNKFKPVDIIKAGDIFTLTGLSNAIPGDKIGEFKGKVNYLMVPTLKSKVLFDETLNPKDVLKFFRILEGEDPALNVEYSELLKEIQVHIMGKIQLEVLKELMASRFNIDVEFGPCKILYKETINTEVIGSGHFEPLRHYAEVHFKIQPAERNSKITFESKCHVDNLNIGHQNLIKTHVFERNHKGILTGSPITDIKITLINGRAHLKHTCGGDFREATYRAIRQGLEKAENILLEPYYKFILEIPLEYMGRAIADIQKLSGEFYAPKTYEDKVIIEGRGPVSTFMDYYLEVIAYTKGKGSINYIYDGYDICHNTEEVIEEISYDKNSDKEYTSNSVFCSHGAGYAVPWDEADKKMHCIIE